MSLSSIAYSAAYSTVNGIAGYALNSLANSALGGTVQAVLSQQLLRSAIVSSIWGVGGTAYDAPDVFVAGIPVTVRTQEAYQWRAEATRHAIESGAVYSDHVILEPLRVDLYFEVSNILPGAAQYACDLFAQMFQRRLPVDLLTEFRKIPNMIMVQFRVENSAPFWGKLVAQATFDQINTVTLETQAADLMPTPISSTPDNSKSAETPTNTGTQTPEPSLLHDIFSGGSS